MQAVIESTKNPNRAASGWSFARKVEAEAIEAGNHSHDSRSSPLSVSLLAKQYHGTFLSFLRRRIPAGPLDPEDIAQEAYIRMLQHEGSRDIRSPYSFLLRVAMNVMQDQRRANQVRRMDRHRSISGLELASNSPDPERAALHAEELDCVLEAIEDLTPRCREVFLQHRLSLSAYPEIARDFGISVKMVEKHISTALARCADRVARQ